MKTKLKSRTIYLRRPNDFVKQAIHHGAVHDHRPGRHVVRIRGRSICFSDHGNKEYTPQYRRLLLKAFIAAGLAILPCALISNLLGI